MGYFSYDHHAAGVAAIVIGLVFMCLGAAVCRARGGTAEEPEGTLASGARRFAGMLILSTGLVGMAVGVVFALMPGTCRKEAQLPLMPSRLDADDQYFYRYHTSMGLSRGLVPQAFPLQLDEVVCSVDPAWPTQVTVNHVTTQGQQRELRIVVEAPRGYVVLQARPIPGGMLTLMRYLKDRRLELVRYQSDSVHLRYVARERFLVELSYGPEEPDLEIRGLRKPDADAIEEICATVIMGARQTRFVWQIRSTLGDKEP